MFNKNIIIIACLYSYNACSAMENMPILQGAYSKKLTSMINNFDSKQDQQYVGYSSNITVIPEYDKRTAPLLVSKRPALYVPGLSKTPAVVEMLQYKKEYAKKAEPSLLYPDNLVVYNTPDQAKGWGVPRINKGTSFGPTEGNALVYRLHDMVNNNGIKKLTLFPICRGATSMVYALHKVLRNSEPENRKTVENFKMNSNDCKNILHAIKSVVLQCPMQKIDDSVELIANKITSSVTSAVRMWLPGCSFGKNILYNDAHAGSIVYPFEHNYLGKAVSDATLHGFLPLWSSYSSIQKNPLEMLIDLQGLKHQSPNMQILMTAKAKDEIIGGDPAKIAAYYNNIPMLDSNKWLLASSATSPIARVNHVTLHDDVKLGWHSFLKNSEASYYLLPSILQKGDTILNNACEEQRNVGLEQYLINAFNANDLNK